MTAQTSREYINDFLYFVIKPEENSTAGNLICYSGVNVDRFTPITKGRHNPMSNPAVRGLQLIQYDIMALAIEIGAVAKTFRGPKSKGLPPTEELWSTASLVITNASPSFTDTILNHVVVALMKKIDLGSTRGAAMPDKLLSPDELQVFIESLCSKYSMQVA